MARTFVPSKHPRDRFGRFTRSRSAQSTDGDREQAAAVATGLKPKRGITGAKAGTYLAGIGDARQWDAVAEYSAGGYVTTHKALRAGKTDDPSVQAMDAAMIELPDDLVVSRRVPKAQFGDIDVDALLGLKVKDAAYSPTSIGAVRATKGDVRLRIAVPAGTRAAVNPDTGEVILDRDLEMVVANVDRNPAGSTDVFLTVLPKAGAAVPKRSPAKNAAPRNTAPAEADTGEQPDGGRVRADLMKQRVPQLQAMMRERGLKPGRLRKSQLVDALVADETGTEGEPGNEPAPQEPASYEARIAAANAGDDALTAVPLSLVRGSTGLPSASRDALDAYRGSSYLTINERLRASDEEFDGLDTADVDQLIADIDKAMTASQLGQSTVTWRGLQSGRRVFGDRLDSDMTGLEWREDAYMSTTAERSVADRFGADYKGVRMRVLTPPGVGAIQLSGVRDKTGHRDEAEILLERGVRMRVAADRGVDTNGTRNLDVEVLPEGAA